MKRTLRRGSSTFEIVRTSETEPGVPPTDVRERVFALAFLRRFQNDRFNMAALRAFFAEESRGLGVRLSSDEDVLDQIAWHVRRGSIEIVEARAPIRSSVGSVRQEAEPAEPAPAEVMAPRPSPSPPQPEAVEEPVMPAAAAQAAALQAAAASGVPFCDV